MASSDNKPKPSVVGGGFLKAWSKALSTDPATLASFFKDHSVFTHTGDGEDVVEERGRENISKRVKQLDLDRADFDYNTLDCQEGVHGGVLVVATGSIKRQNTTQQFAQTFFLAPQEQPTPGYYVHNSVFRTLAHHHAHGNAPQQQAQHQHQHSPKPAAQNHSEHHAASATQHPQPAQHAHAAATATATATTSETQKPHHHEEKKTTESPAHEQKQQTPPTAQPQQPPAQQQQQAAPSKPKSWASAAAAPPAPQQAQPPQPRAPKEPKPAAVKQASPKLSPSASASASSSASSAQSAFPPTALFVRNLPYSTSDDALYQEFSKFGKLKSVENRSGYAFLEFETLEAADSLLQRAAQEPMMRIGDRPITVERRKSEKETKASKVASRGGRGGGRGGKVGHSSSHSAHSSSSSPSSGSNAGSNSSSSSSAPSGQH